VLLRLPELNVYSENTISDASVSSLKRKKKELNNFKRLPIATFNAKVSFVLKRILGEKYLKI